MESLPSSNVPRSTTAAQSDDDEEEEEEEEEQTEDDPVDLAMRIANADRMEMDGEEEEEEEEEIVYQSLNTHSARASVPPFRFLLHLLTCLASDHLPSFRIPPRQSSLVNLLVTQEISYIKSSAAHRIDHKRPTIPSLLPPDQSGPCQILQDLLLHPSRALEQVSNPYRIYFISIRPIQHFPYHLQDLLHSLLLPVILHITKRQPTLSLRISVRSIILVNFHCRLYRPLG